MFPGVVSGPYRCAWRCSTSASKGGGLPSSCWVAPLVRPLFWASPGVPAAEQSRYGDALAKTAVGFPRTVLCAPFGRVLWLIPPRVVTQWRFCETFRCFCSPSTVTPRHAGSVEWYSHRLWVSVSFGSKILHALTASSYDVSRSLTTCELFRGWSRNAVTVEWNSNSSLQESSDLRFGGGPEPPDPRRSYVVVSVFRCGSNRADS